MFDYRLFLSEHHFQDRRMFMFQRVLLFCLMTCLLYLFVFSVLHVPSLIQIGVLALVLGALKLASKSIGYQHAAVLMSLILIGYLTVTSSVVYRGSSYHYLILVSVFGFAITRNIRIGTILFLIAFSCFFLVEFLQVRIEPLYKLEYKTELFVNVLNQVLIFALCYYLVLNLKFANDIYERKLIHQKNEIDKKNNAIMESMTYAHALQEAILPIDVLSTELGWNHFIFQRNKEIVGGDFCWFRKKEGWTYFAVADCTGHGVPGAILSVLCAQFLDKALGSKESIEPGEMLDEVSLYISEMLRNKSNVQSDGMDISLCAIKENKLVFAGAYNPVIVVREKELHELMVDRWSVGYQKLHKSFETKTFTLEEKDRVYLFSDGFMDQFGGDRGKKYGRRRFYDLLKELQLLEMEDQRHHLEEILETWRGGKFQVDDITVFGLEFSNEPMR